MEIPCHECLTISVCKHEDMNVTVSKCPEIKKWLGYIDPDYYISTPSFNPKKLVMLYDYLKPKGWRIAQELYSEIKDSM